VRYIPTDKSWRLSICQSQRSTIHLSVDLTTRRYVSCWSRLVWRSLYHLTLWTRMRSWCLYSVFDKCWFWPASSRHSVFFLWEFVVSSHNYWL